MIDSDGKIVSIVFPTPRWLMLPILPQSTKELTVAMRHVSSFYKAGYKNIYLRSSDRKQKSNVSSGFSGLPIAVLDRMFKSKLIRNV